MNESRHVLILFALAVSRGILSSEEAGRALAGIRGSSAAALRSGPSLARDALGAAWATLSDPQRSALEAELQELLADAGRAELLVLTSPIPEAEKRAWWGEHASQVAAGEVVVDVDFAHGATQIRPGPGQPAEPRAPSLPSLSPDERYEVQRDVARGGMGRIMLAKDVTLGRNVALKEVLAGSAAEGASAENVERFLREARITGQLEHPNIVPVHELGQRSDGRMYYTMKLVRGETMEKRLAVIMGDARLGPGEKLGRRLKLLDAFVDVCNAVAYAHSRGVVNRDLKPSNVMLGDFGETVVLDWGLARVAGTEDRARKDVERVTLTLHASDPAKGSSKLTMDGAIMGTPAYMSPEQARGALDEVDERSDVFTLGAMLYEIVTGVPPFTGPTAMDVVRAVAQAEPPPATTREPLAPRELEALAARAMAKEKSQRLGSAKLLAEEVLAFRDGRNLTTYTYTGAQQVARWVKRHRGATAGIAAAVLAMICGTAVSAYWARHASEQRRDAQVSEQRATVEAEKATSRARDAEEAARRAEGLRLAANARVRATKNPGQALWLAIRGAELEVASETTSALFDALSRISERRRLYGSEGYVRAATFSPDGTRVATGGDDQAVRLWDARTGEAGPRLDAHTGTVTQVVFSPDGARLLSASEDGTVRLWDAADGRLLGTARGYGRAAQAGWSPDGRNFVTWGAGVPARLWTRDGTGGTTLGTEAASCAAFGPGGARVAVAGATGVRVFEGTSPEPKTAIPCESALAGVAWSLDGVLVVATCADGTVRAWDAAGGAARWVSPPGDSSSAGDIAVSPDGLRAAARHGKTLRILRLADGSVEATLPFPGEFGLPTFSPDWKTFLKPEGVDVVSVELATGETVAVYSGHSYGVQHVEFSRDGRQFVSASNDMTAGVWDVVPGRELPWLTPPKRRGHVEDLDPERGLFLVDAQGELVVSDTRTGEPLRTLGAVPSGRGGGSMFLADGSVVVWTTDPPGVRILDGRTGAVLRELECPPGRSGIGPARGDVLVGSFEGQGPKTFRAWTTNGTVLGTVTLDVPVTQYDVSSDGRTLLCAHAGMGTAGLFSISSGERLHSLAGHSGWVINARFLGDGRRCMTGAADSSCRVWDTATGKCIAVLRWPRIETLRMAPSPDGARAWIFGGTEARLFDTETGRRLGSLDGSHVQSATWFADSSAAVFCYRNGTFRVIPTDPLPAARRALPRDLAPFELADLEIGTDAERLALGREWNARHPLAYPLSRSADQLLDAGRAREALDSYTRALAIYPRHLPALVGQASAFSALATEDAAERGKYVAQGLTALRRALEFGLDPREIDRLGPALDALRASPDWEATLKARPER